MIMGVVNIPQTIRLIAHFDDLDEVIEILMRPLLTFVVCLVKLLHMWLFKEVMRPIVASIAEDWTTPKTKSQENLMLKYARLTRKISATFFIVGYLALLFYVIIYTFTEVQRKYPNGTEVHREFLFHADYIYDTSSTPVYLIVCSLQVLTVMYAALSFFTFDFFFAMMILHLCAQIAIQRAVIQNLDLGHSNGEKKVNFQGILRSLVTRHDHLCWFAGKVEDSFNMVSLSLLLTCSIQFCLLGYRFIETLMTGTREAIIMEGGFLAMYTSSLGLILFLFCYLGQCLHDESTGFCNSCYECEWYNLSPQDARCIIVLMIRSQCPLEITAGKFSALSFVTCAQILQTSLGYMSMLIAVKSKQLEMEN
ncbi:odorant receptor 13a [Orussus abietinus]|uniref:odorant receptor 13a n=1 Tax=Orussus abietinus TaxID=222816 RepID=UPI0006259629|nr:odorant receptor 13a [Orussus abietinus]